MRGVAFDWFQSYLSDRTQYTTINNQRSETQTIKYGVPQGYILGLLLFLININDLNRSIKNSKIHHFADDINLLYLSKILQKNQLMENKIALYVNKTNLVIFWSPREEITKKMNFCLNISEYLLFKDHITL